MAFSTGSGGGVRSDINITPLVDVVLVLLIIFMVMTPTLLKELSVVVPEKTDVQIVTPTTTDQLIVAVSRENKITVNQEPIAEAAVADRIHDLLAARADKLVFFDIDDEADYGEVVHVMDLVRGAGAKTLGIMTKQ
jgi:biopolymer transport protein TolR